ncbi:MAG: alkaline phosphatase D family protein [Acidobacteria bacterium]|nr:alkaline phosphatase D family protein [Acidobacteriota bacterium]
MNRREFIAALGLAGGCLPSLRGAGTLDPVAVQSGDVTPGSAIVWARSAVPAKMSVEWRTHAGGDVRKVRGPELTAETDFTARAGLKNLPDGQVISYTVRLSSPTGKELAPLRGKFRTPPKSGSDVRFLWSGDMVGQGWGIQPESKGIQIFETMRRLEPHFFIHSGDTIYADGPLVKEVSLPGGGVWRNIVTEEKSKVAETLNEFRGCYRYNLLDESVRRFSSEVAQFWQWDDHELGNNWSPTRSFTDDSRYKEKDLAVLLNHARQAFLEYAPLRQTGPRIYRKIPYGPMLDVFMLDMRSYRAGNSYNLQPVMTPETAYLGARQLDWLQAELRKSTAVWKVVAADMPLGLIVGDGKDAQGRRRFENSCNGDGKPLGRELEIAALLRGIKRANVRNVVWVTADVHYTAAHFYDPEKAQFDDFLPFWEFVSGPMNAGTFGPGVMDNTFGPQVMFAKAPPAGRSNLSPLEGYQFFGDVMIDAKTRSLTVILRDLTGAALYTKTLPAEIA